MIMLEVGDFFLTGISLRMVTRFVSTCYKLESFGKVETSTEKNVIPFLVSGNIFLIMFDVGGSILLCIVPPKARWSWHI